MRAGIPLPPPVLPWNLAGPEGGPLVVTWELFRTLSGSAFAVSLLGAIESLLSAVVADGMTGYKHDPDAELMAQGVGNLVAPFFGGFAATGAIARTATNIRAGGRSPVAAVVHALFVLGAMVSLAPLLGHLPMAALAALLLVVAWNMGEFKHVYRMARIAPGSDVAVLLTCFLLTVLFDMVVSVSVGFVLAAVLFMRRMVEVAELRLIREDHPAVQLPLPAGVMLYEIAGPLFFGAAQKAMSSLRTVRPGVRCVVLNLSDVPVIDATGLVNLESTVERLNHAGVYVILAGVQSAPAEALRRAKILESPGRLTIRGSFEEAVAAARAWAVVSG
ncbi:MAG: SulP family inorganic anion transporter [Phycisphaerae bacterium]